MSHDFAHFRDGYHVSDIYRNSTDDSLFAFGMIYDITIRAETIGVGAFDEIDLEIYGQVYIESAKFAHHIYDKFVHRLIVKFDIPTYRWIITDISGNFGTRDKLDSLGYTHGIDNSRICGLKNNELFHNEYSR